MHSRTLPSAHTHILASHPRWHHIPVGWHVHAAMLTRASPALLVPTSLSHVLRSNLHLDGNELSHLSETIFNGLNSLE
jgi:hypothetical protein